jgi:transposase-like protein
LRRFSRVKKAVLERALGAELRQHLGYGKGEDKPEHQTNHRNGASGKRILTDQGSLEIEIPRDRESKEVVEFYRCIYDER